MNVPIYTFTTVGASTQTVTFDPGVSTASGFKFQVDMVGFEPTTPAAYAITLEGCGRTNGTTATIVGTELKDIFSDVALAGCSVVVAASGNTLQLQVTGVVALSIDWRAGISLIFVG